MRVLCLVTSPGKTFYESRNAALREAGVDLTVLPVPGENQAQSTAADGSGTRSALDYLRYLPRVLRHSFGDYDLVHASYGLTGPAAVAQPNLPVVLSLWGSDLMGRYGRVSRWCARRCDAAIVMSEGMAEVLGQPCHVIPHGIDLERFAPAPAATARADLGWAEDARHVLFPYPRKREVKDFPRAERVVAEVRGRLDAPVELHVAEGIPYDRMPLHMNAADALLLTSRREGMPNTVKEALACNLPVVSTDVGDVAAWLADVEPSAVADSDRALADALVEVLSRRERSNGREAVRHVAWPRVADRIVSVYRSVLEGAGRGSVDAGAPVRERPTARRP
jgi:glycosyltransferase involved in cell wall biosynthesis